MDTRRFDALMRHFGQDSSRRRLLGLLGGTTLGSLLAARLVDDADAKKRKKKKKCKGCTECQLCQKGKCTPKANGVACTNDGFCQDGVCRTVDNCPSNQVCEISDRCCPQPPTDIGGGIVACEFPDVTYLCECAGGTTICQYGDGFADCCTGSEECDPQEGCVPS